MINQSSRPNAVSKVSAGSDVNLPLRIPHKLGKCGILTTLLYDWDFYSSVDDPPLPLKCYRAKQQDACQYSHDGPLAATDGSLSLQKERMSLSASFIVEKPASAFSL